MDIGICLGQLEIRSIRSIKDLYTAVTNSPPKAPYPPLCDKI